MDQYVMIPRILKETSAGIVQYSIQDQMLRNRQIECVGEITADMVNAVILQLRYLQSEDKEKEIIMYINSPGGQVSSGLALYDVMKAIKCPIRTVCVGAASSIAALLFISGNERDMLPHARVMIHDPKIAGEITGSALSIHNISMDLMNVREILGGIIAKHTGKTIDEVFLKTAKDSFFNAEEAIAFGLADNIINEI